MQGLPIQTLEKSMPGSKKIKGEIFDIASGMTEVELGVEGTKSEVKGQKGDFSALLQELTGKSATKASGVKTETGDILKNLLIEKNKENTDDKISTVEVIDPGVAQAIMAPVLEQGKHIEKNNSENISGKIEQKVAKTSSNLDQLLMGLKGAEDNEESDDVKQSDVLEGTRPKKSEHQIKSELKSESPLEFLMNGTKTKNVSETATIAAPKNAVSLMDQQKVMTGEDYLNNKESSDKLGSGKLALVNGLTDLPKNNVQNVKGYGLGLSLLSDPLIKSTKDLAFKEVKKGNSTSAIDELRTPDSKVGAELSAIKQDVMPGIQTVQKNHEQADNGKAESNQKVLDLGKINTANTTEIIKRISDYVEQNQVANKSSLDLTVKHESLGEFKIQVSKMPTQTLGQGSSLIDMQITTSSKEGHDFFVKNEVSLMKNLNQAGINLSDLRIISTMSESTLFGQSDSRHSSSQSQNPDGTNKQFMSFESSAFSSDTRNGSDRGSERRKELWEEYQQRYGA